MTSAWLWLATLAALLAVQADGLREHVDAARKFQFTYPAAFGTPSPGTNDGFGDRVAAIRFSVFSTAAIGGEAALTRGFPVIDLQAVGGLYDAITLEIFPDPLRQQVIAQLTPLTASNFCAEFAREQHLDPASLPGLTAQLQAAVANTDRMRNIQPRVVRCTASGETVTFDKEVGFQPSGPRQHVYGAVRFLPAPYSTFQVVRAGPAPDAALLDQITAIVQSWRPL